MDGIKIFDPKHLKFIIGNRETNSNHVSRIANSMKKMGNLLPKFPIEINEHHEIIDGQHRTKAALRIGLKEVPCIIRKGATLKDAQEANINRRNWTTPNFAKSYAVMGNPDYKVLVEFMENTGLGIDAAMRLLGGSHSGAQWHNIKDGTFKVKSVEYAYKTANKIGDFKDLFPQWYKSRAFINAFLYILNIKGYNHKRMLHKCTMRQLRRCPNTDYYIEQFEKFYNFAAPAEERVRFTRI
jgi:hypothetical protein